MTDSSGQESIVQVTYSLDLKVNVFAVWISQYDDIHAPIISLILYSVEKHVHQ